MHSAWFRSTFLRVVKFVHIKEGGCNFCWEGILQKVWIIWAPFLYFNFKSFLHPNSLSLLRFHCTVHDLGLCFSESSNFYKLKRRGSNFLGEPILQKVRIMWSPLLYFNFKSFLNLSTSSFLRFQCILYDSGALSSEFSSFYKLKRRHLIFWEKHFSRRSELFDPLFCISILKVF